MRVKFQADAGLDGRIIRRLRRLAPEIDIRTSGVAKLAVWEIQKFCVSSATRSESPLERDRRAHSNLERQRG